MKAFSLALLLSLPWLCLASEGTAATEEPMVKTAEALYKVGQVLTYEITIPKSGRIGSPSGTASANYPLPAVREEDFEKKFARVLVQEKRITPRGVKVILQVDEVTKEGEVLNKALYFLHVDVSPQGTAVMRRMSKDGEVEGCVVQSTCDLPCPLDLSRPPQLGFRQGVLREGFVVSGYWGAAFTKEPPKGEATSITVNAVLFDAYVRLPKPPDAEVKWYAGKELDTLTRDTRQLDARRSDKKMTYVLFTEKQKWVADDWLWTEMERWHPDGHILMRCRRIQAPPTEKEK